MSIIGKKIGVETSFHIPLIKFSHIIWCRMKTTYTNMPKMRAAARPSKALLTLRELTRELGVCEATIRSWKGCPKVAIGKRSDGRGKSVRYHLETVINWLNSKRSA